ncbi:dihydrofolate reductase family protein [Methylobacterium nodulans]|uniref:Putative 5-amino-6-(5-phosphoribosylamino)uracil reductase n=1 Tax=Methylobacterium nodulans (strain LMG 21967 / CNCM I-2342 / ORS 2060) TaxID=460265 RepID=B8IVA9_METNO|nr:dihydrofolate reductase family protein [Methylobacterium nodulans]ACL60960.1 putative 5-amino-6-(5-phosphoribosylamino)uracil reductase [Methylobacterium nodulans ORS 2060]
MRPKIICHMVSSVDGRLLVGRWTPPAKGIEAGLLHRHYEEVAGCLNGEGWIVGRTTMAEIAKGKPRTLAAIPAELRGTHVADRKGRDLAVAIDPHGKVHYGQDDVGGDHVVAVLGEGVTDAYLAELREDGVSYLFAGPDGHDLAGAMATLGEVFGVGTLLLEGGGAINGAFLKAGLIDEVSLLVHPAIDGLAGVPSIFDYRGAPDEKPAAGRALRHFRTETLDGGTVWLRYRVEDAPAS